MLEQLACVVLFALLCSARFHYVVLLLLPACLPACLHPPHPLLHSQHGRWREFTMGMAFMFLLLCFKFLGSRYK